MHLALSPELLKVMTQTFNDIDAQCKSASYSEISTQRPRVTSLPQYLPAQISVNFTLIMDMPLRIGELAIIWILQSNRLIQRRGQGCFVSGGGGLGGPPPSQYRNQIF